VTADDDDESQHLSGTRSCPADICLFSPDRRFGIHLPRRYLRILLEYAAKDYPKETGGILLGSYTPSLELAVVTEVTGPPDDSRKGRFGFWRGVRGLQSLVGRLWKERQYYLGEWHVHPDGPPVPSGTDEEQMRAIAESPVYQCPEPLLLILGYTREPRNERWSAGLYVFPRGMRPVALTATERRSGHGR
jgi:integrative and conjugative element protein (TIGR02256 family)